MSYYRGDDVTDEYGNTYRDGINVGSDFNANVPGSEQGGIYEGRFRYEHASDPSVYGSGLPSPALAALVLGIPSGGSLFNEIAPQPIRQAAESFNRALQIGGGLIAGINNPGRNQAWPTTEATTTAATTTPGDPAATSFLQQESLPGPWGIYSPTRGRRRARRKSARR